MSSLALTQHLNHVLCGLHLRAFGEISPPIGGLVLGAAPSNSSLEAHTAASTSQTGASQLQSDEGVQHRDERHRCHEEHEGRNLEGVWDDFALDGANAVVCQHPTVWQLLVHKAELQRLRHRQTQRQQPDHQNETHCPRELHR